MSALALHQTTSISADSHLKDEVDASIPTLIDRRAEIGWFAAIVGRGGDKHDVVLQHGKANISSKQCILKITNRYTCIYKHILAYTNIYIHIRTDMGIYMQIHTYTYIYIHIHAYTCIY